MNLIHTKKKGSGTNMPRFARPVKTVKDPAVAQAEKLWKALQDSWGNTEQNITNIIRSRAWEPLGYESFEKAWVDKMGDFLLSGQMAAHVVYELFDEGLTVEQVYGITSGVGPEQLRDLKRQKDIGIPADKTAKKRRCRTADTTTVREHDRKLPSERCQIHLKLSASELKEWVVFAKTKKSTVHNMLIALMRAAIAEEKTK